MLLTIVIFKGYTITEKMVINTRFVSELWKYNNPSVLMDCYELIMASGHSYIIDKETYREIKSTIKKEEKQ